MTTPPVEQCACCGAEIGKADRIDFTVPLPELARPSADTDPNAAFLRLENGRAFARCRVPVALTGGTTLMYLTWIEISADDLRRAAAAWRDESWVGLVLHGTLANDLKPWSKELLGAEVMTTVGAADEPPTVVNSDHEPLRRMLTETWDRDVVLNWFNDPLPIALRTRVGKEWSLERSAGLAAGLDGRTWRFATPGRSVFVDVLTDAEQRAPGDFLHELLDGAPEVPPERTLITPTADDLTHAFWLETVVDGRPQQDFYAHVVRRGTALSIGVFHSDPDDHAWALHVLRSVKYHG